ncbi:hypothetical protein FBU30_008548 [Linnemannia zychae]|nr:hypothetical protein FBU30_008548 [Linnemannia zychae]
MVLEVPSPSTSSPSTARVSSKSTERLKRPRHQSGDLHENASDEKNLIEPSHIVARQDKDNKLHSNHTKKHTADAPINTRRDSLQIPTPSHTSQHERTVILQVRQPSRIHPFDNESIAPNISGMPHDDRHHPLDGPMKTPASLTEMEPSIHPLDPEARENTKSRQSYPIEKKHREALDHKQPTPEHNTQRSITTSQQQNTDIIPSNEIISNHSSSLHNSSSVSTPISRPQQQPALQTNRSVAPSSAAAKPNAVALQLPITRDTLRELDLFEIFKNPQLRHDIVFDPHLQFRPNFDGERGLAKRREADRFWHEVGTELNARRAILTARRDATTKMLNLAGLSSSSPSSRMIQQQAQQMCPLPKAVLLPRLIDELREILLSLLPAVPNNHDKSSQQDGANQENSERALLSSTLDPDLLLQELDHGVLDVHKLFRYLGDSLKGHCAPMRDTLVESMVHTVVNLDEIVRGIRMCFEILEWMKLDIANHQLRTLRPWLLDNSIDFEQRYFTEHLQRGGSLQRTTEWFKKSWICWESVKQLVIGRSSPNVATFTASHQPSLAPSLTVEQDGSSKGSSPAIVQPAYAAIGFKRRTSVVSTDIGENILDGVVNEGLLEMILQPHGSVSTMPETFELDHYRMLLFHNDFQDLTILCILLILFRQLAHNCWTQQDLIEIKKVVWLLLTDENANFGANTQTGKSGSGQNGSSSNSGGSSGMKDIVIQIEFAARKVRERGVNTSATATPPVATGSRRSSLSPEIPIPTAMGVRRGSLASSVQPVAMATGNSFHSQKYASNIQRPLSIAGLTPILPTTTKSAPIAIPSLSASDTNLLTAWLDNALCRTSTLYKLIQKRLLIHFRRWLYLHSCSTMLVLSASCASLASAISMSSQGTDSDNQCKGDDDDDESTISEIRSGGISEQCNDSNGISSAKNNHEQTEGGVPNTPLPANTTSPAQSIEEANKAAAEALAAKLSFNTTEMEAHGLIGLEDEMTALLEKIRAVSEFNKKVYGSWYRDLVKQGRSERWLESAASSISISSSNSSTGDPDSGSSVTSKSNATSAFSASTSNNQNASTKTMA